MENKFIYLTKYSLNKKIKNKWFLIVNVLLLIMIIFLTNIDFVIKSFGGDFNDDLNIKLYCKNLYCNDIILDLKNNSKLISENKVIIENINNVNKEKRKLKNNKNTILLIINDDKKNIYNVDFISYTYVNQIEYQFIINSLNNTKSKIALNNYNISDDDINMVYQKVDVKRQIISNENNDEISNSIIMLLSIIISLPTLILIIFLIQMIGSEINEEKSTKSMEIIIGNISAKMHFLSKIISSNIFVIIQSVLLSFYSLLGLFLRKALIPKSSDLISNITTSLNMQNVINNSFIDELSYKIPLIIILLILSFLAYSIVSGILASVTTNMENYQQLQTPLLLVCVIGYYLIFLSTTFKGSILIKILSCIPLVSISLAPSLLLTNDISVEVMFISIILVGLFDYILFKYGIRIYKNGILNYDESNLWKKLFKFLKN